MKQSTRFLMAAMLMAAVAIGYCAVTDDGSDGATIQTSGYGSLAEAFAAANDGDTIVLSGDVTVNEVITVDKRVTLDLNGHTITNNVNGLRPFYASADFRVDGTTAGSSMVIPSGNTTSPGFINVYSKMVLTLNGGSYSGNTVTVDENYMETSAGFIMICEDSTVVLNDVTMTSNNQFVDTATLSNDVNTPTLIVNGGTYTSDFITFHVDTWVQSPVLFTDVTATVKSGPCVEISGSGAVFTNCHLSVTDTTGIHDWSSAAIGLGYEGSVTINGGTYESTKYGVYVYSSGGTIILNSGTVSGEMNAVRVGVDKNSYPNAVSSIIVNGGTTIGEWYPTSSSNEILAANGGTHTADVSDYVPAGTEMFYDESTGKYAIVNEDTNIGSGSTDTTITVEHGDTIDITSTSNSTKTVTVAFLDQDVTLRITGSFAANTVYTVTASSVGDVPEGYDLGWRIETPGMSMSSMTVTVSVDTDATSGMVYRQADDSSEPYRLASARIADGTLSFTTTENSYYWITLIQSGGQVTWPGILDDEDEEIPTTSSSSDSGSDDVTVVACAAATVLAALMAAFLIIDRKR